MSTEFIIWKVSELLIQDFENFGRPAFDAFWQSDFIENINDRKEIAEAFSEEDTSHLPNLLGESFFPIIQEGFALHYGEDEFCEDNFGSYNGAWIAAIDFLLCGRFLLEDRNFLVKNYFDKNLKSIILVNALFGKRILIQEACLDATYFTSEDLKEVINGLNKVLEDDFAWRWHTFQKIIFDGAKKDEYSDRFIEYWNRPFAESFSNVSNVDEFIEEHLLKIYSSAVQSNQGILMTRAS